MIDGAMTGEFGLMFVLGAAFVLVVLKVELVLVVTFVLAL